MSNKSQPPVRNAATVDPRILRSTRALARALIELIQERDFDGITVQTILDRAGVGRTTFYAHYRNKEDVLHSSYEHLFSVFEPMLERPSRIGKRLFPVTELLDHVSESQGVVNALRGAGQLDYFSTLFAGEVARVIEKRLDSSAGVASGIPRPLLARMFAGTLMEMIKWWQDHPAAMAPERLDAAFHEVARAALRKPG